MRSRIRPTLSWRASIEEIVDAARARGAEPVWLFLPTIAMIGNEFDTSELATLARDAGFAVVELDGVYQGHEAVELRLAPWDLHPNVLGHQLIANRLYNELAERPQTARPGLSQVKKARFEKILQHADTASVL